MEAAIDADLAALEQACGKNDICKADKSPEDKALAAFLAEMKALEKAKGCYSIIHPRKTKQVEEAQAGSKEIVKTLRHKKMVKIKIDQALIDLFEKKPIKPMNLSPPDPFLAALEKMQIEMERNILEQCRNINGYAEVEVLVE